MGKKKEEYKIVEKEMSWDENNFNREERSQHPGFAAQGDGHHLLPSFQGLALLPGPSAWLKLLPPERLLREGHPTVLELDALLKHRLKPPSSSLLCVCMGQGGGTHSFVRGRLPQVPHFGLESWETMWGPGTEILC